MIKGLAPAVGSKPCFCADLGLNRTVTVKMTRVTPCALLPRTIPWLYCRVLRCCYSSCHLQFWDGSSCTCLLWLFVSETLPERLQINEEVGKHCSPVASALSQPSITAADQRSKQVRRRSEAPCDAVVVASDYVQTLSVAFRMPCLGAATARARLQYSAVF